MNLLSPATPSRSHPIHFWWRQVLAGLRAIGFAPFLLLAAFALPPTQGKSLLGIPTLCVFRRLTGFPCPGCGMTRSIVCIAHGHWHTALQFHPLGVVVFGWMLLATLRRLPRFRQIPIPNAGIEIVLAVLAAGILLVWGLRLAGVLGAPP